MDCRLWVYALPAHLCVWLVDRSVVGWRGRKPRISATASKAILISMGHSAATQSSPLPYYLYGHVKRIVLLFYLGRILSKHPWLYQNFPRKVSIHLLSPHPLLPCPSHRNWIGSNTAIQNTGNPLPVPMTAILLYSDLNHITPSGDIIYTCTWAVTLNIGSSSIASSSYSIGKILPYQKKKIPLSTMIYNHLLASMTVQVPLRLHPQALSPLSYVHFLSLNV